MIKQFHSFCPLAPQSLTVDHCQTLIMEAWMCQVQHLALLLSTLVTRVSSWLEWTPGPVREMAGQEKLHSAKVSGTSKLAWPVNYLSLLSDKGTDCGKLDDPDYGHVSFGSTTPGSTAVYACNKGFELVGVFFQTCQIDGTWSSEAPTCKGKQYHAPQPGWLADTCSLFHLTPSLRW